MTQTITIETITASDQITEELASWPGITVGYGSRGEWGFRLGSHEVGHLHGGRAAHLGVGRELGLRLREEGRVVDHPVFPGKPAMAARAITGEDDVRDVIAMMRLNYDRLVERYGLPGRDPRMKAVATSETAIAGLWASTPDPLPFGRDLAIRAFLLERDAGNILLYSVAGLEADAAAISERGGISRWYLNHRHEAMFASDSVDAPLFVHEADAGSVDKRLHVRGSFSRRHLLDDDFEVIPTPGHTPGATAYLWDTGEHRLLFTGDTVYFDRGEWVAALLDSSDRDDYVTSLELIRELDFDVLVPWAATAGQPYYAMTDRADAQARIDAILERIRRGEDR